MKKRIITILTAVVAAIALCSLSVKSVSHTVVILSTNDMHAQIDKFPKLATAIQKCRDTAEVILVDAGDKWTGNAYVDLVEHYQPIFDLMNKLDYDLSIFGNHEFDKGQAYLAEANKLANFVTLGANIISDTVTFPQPQPYHIVTRNGITVGFVGAVGNYDSNNHPAGKDESYAGIRFVDPQQCAAEYAYLKDEVDVLIYINHTGVERDREFAASELSKGYDMVIGSHSHDVVDEVVNGIQLSQTGSRLKNIGATVISYKRGSEPIISYRNIPLADYAEEAEFAAMVEEYYNNPELKAPIGQAAETFNKQALKNLFTHTIRDRVGADVGIYHSGGVRLEQIPQGDISFATLLNLEPFSAVIYTMEMTPEQIRKMIMAKFNDTINIGESHYIDLNATVEYTVKRDANGDAVDIVFPTLTEGKYYKIAIGDYITAVYKGLEYRNGVKSDILLTDVFSDYIKANGSIVPDNKIYQTIE